MCGMLNVFHITEGIASLLYGMVSLFVLVNSCQSGTLKVIYKSREIIVPKIEEVVFQIKYLVESIELYAFWTTDNVHLHHLKQEIFSQISYLPIYITGSEFFTIDRKYLAGVSISKRRPAYIMSQQKCFFTAFSQHSRMQTCILTMRDRHFISGP